MSLKISIPVIAGIYVFAFYEYGAAWIIFGGIITIILSSLISKR